MLGYNYGTVLFIDTDTNAIEAAGELYNDNIIWDWWRNGGEEFHWGKPLSFDYKYGCAIIASWKFLAGPGTIF